MAKDGWMAVKKRGQWWPGSRGGDGRNGGKEGQVKCPPNSSTKVPWRPQGTFMLSPGSARTHVRWCNGAGRAPSGEGNRRKRRKEGEGRKRKEGRGLGLVLGLD